MSALNLRIYIPTGLFLSLDVEEVLLPTTGGYIGVLPNHMAMMTLLDIGILRLRPTDPASNAASGWDSVVVMGGCALIEGGGITIYAENAETRASLGDESGKEGSLLTDARDEVATAKNAVSSGDVFMATKSVKRAEARIKLWDEPTFQGN